MLLDCTSEDIARAYHMVDSQSIEVCAAARTEAVYIRVAARGENDIAEAVISGDHGSIRSVKKNGESTASGEPEEDAVPVSRLRELRFCEVLEEVAAIPPDDVACLPAGRSSVQPKHGPGSTQRFKPVRAKASTQP